jgi:hypothetical protein
LRAALRSAGARSARSGAGVGGAAGRFAGSRRAAGTSKALPS